MNKPTDLCEIIMIETENYDKFPRKKLIKTYTKFNNIKTAFTQNRFMIGSGLECKQVLTKLELKLIHEEIDNSIRKYGSKELARDALFKFYIRDITDSIEGMKPLIDALPEDVKATHFDCQCGSKVLMAHKARHLKSPLHLNIVNKVEPMPKEQKVEAKVECGCGKSFSSKNKSHHNKTQYHLDWERVTKEDTQSFCL